MVKSYPVDEHADEESQVSEDELDLGLAEDLADRYGHKCAQMSCFLCMHVGDCCVAGVTIDRGAKLT